MPEEVGGAGLHTLTWLLYEKELGKANYALHWTCVARPSNILLAGTEEQRERYLYPCIRGEKWDCLAMTEPGAGSDLRGMKASAREEGGDFVLNGTKHFISHADIADFAITFMATGEEETPRGPKKRITAFFVDKGTKGFAVLEGYRNVSHRGYTNAVLEFDDCRLPKSLIIDELGYLPFEPNAANLFFQLVSHRYERGSLVITSNRSVGEWDQILGDPVVATAILDRLLHHSHVVTIRGESYRLREKRRSGLFKPAPVSSTE